MGGANALVHGGEVRINVVMVLQPKTCNGSIWHARGAQGLQHLKSPQILLTGMGFTGLLSSEDTSFEARPRVLEDVSLSSAFSDAGGR